MRRKFFIFLILSLFFLSLPLAKAELRLLEVSSRNKPLVIQMQTGFYRSVSNYRGFGKYTDLPDENYFQYVEMHPKIYYTPFGFPLQFEIFMNNFYAMSQSAGVKRDVFRPTVAGGGFSLWYKFQNLYGGLELRGGVPLYGNVYGNFHTPEEMVVGDGAYFLEPGLYAVLRPSKLFYVYSRLAFRYRMFVLSGLLLNQLGGVVRTQHISFGLLMDSSVSATGDQFSAQPDRRHSRLNKVNGASLRFYAVNPSVLSVVPWMEFNFRPAIFRLYVSLDVTGQTRSRGLGFGLITKLKWNTRASVAAKRKTLKYHFQQPDIRMDDPPEEEESGAYFKEEEDPYTKKNLNRELKEELDSLKY